MYMFGIFEKFLQFCVTDFNLRKSQTYKADTQNY